MDRVQLRATDGSRDRARRGFASKVGAAGNGARGLGVSLLVLAALALFPAAADAYVYWTNGPPPSSSVGRADLDGTGVRPHFIPVSTAGTYMRDLALDADRLYWAAACPQYPAATPPCTSGAIGRANVDGTGVAESLIGGIDPGGVAVDAEHIYLTWSDCDLGWGLSGPVCTTDELQGTPGGIARANLDGTGVDLDFISGIDAGYVAVDAQYIYWTGNFCDGVCTGGSADPWVPAIGRANLDGTGVDRSFIVTGTNVTTDLAVDAGHIYWTGQVSAPACCGAALGRASLDGTSVDPMLISGSCCLKPPFWAGVAVDGAHIYWTEYLSDPQAPTRSIRRANIDGSGTTPFILPDGDKGFHPGALALDAVTVAKAEGQARAARTQRQTGPAIVVTVKVEAREELTAKAKGKIKINPTYKLEPQTVGVARGETKKLRLKPKKAKARKIGRALKRGENATAQLKVKLTDQAGNRETERLPVRLTG